MARFGPPPRSQPAGQGSLTPADAQVEAWVERVRQASGAGAEIVPPSRKPSRARAALGAETAQVTVEEAREAGSVHVGHQMWQQLGLSEILCRAGLSDRASKLSEAMALNRLIFPLSAHAMPDRMRRTVLADILQTDFSVLHGDALYRNLDRLYPRREVIERELAEREKTLFNLDDTLYLYDLTSTYFEGEASNNPQAQRGYSRDKRSDAKQVLVGLVLDREGFPIAHEIFEGNRQDRTTVKAMLDTLEKRWGASPVQPWWWIAAWLTKKTWPRSRRTDTTTWSPLASWSGTPGRTISRPMRIGKRWPRIPSPRNPDQEKSEVRIKRRQKGKEVYILCVSQGRQEKDRAIRETHEERLKKDLEKLKARIEKGQLKQTQKIYQAMGRLVERYPRVARYDRMDYDTEPKALTWREDSVKKAIAEKLDGGYILKTDRQDLSANEIWRTYILLTRVEAAFRAMKSPLAEQPIFHHLEHRTPNAYLSLRPGLPPAGGRREAIPGSWRAHLMVDLAPATEHPSSGHGRLAYGRRQGSENSHGHDAGTDSPRNLLHPPDSGRGDEAGEKLAPRVPIVTE